jgi:glycosyltransferase involved in cell wall biosynthesis
MIVDARENAPSPYFSICIPQYNRTPFLLAGLRALAVQSFRTFEICISDDGSTDGRGAELLAALVDLEQPFVYAVQDFNAGYDSNLRSSIALSRGRYCVLMGNDDALAAASTLQLIHDSIEAHRDAGVVLGNHADMSSGVVTRNFADSCELGRGPRAAVKLFRRFAFVSGVTLDGPRARDLATSRWDGGEMYQMYLGCRILAEGKVALGLHTVLVSKDIVVEDEMVDSYARRPREPRWPIRERPLPLNRLGALVVNAVADHFPECDRQAVIVSVFFQILMYTYVYWLFEYRRVQSWSYAAGVCLAMRPARLLAEVRVGPLTRLRTTLLYVLVSVAGLTIPLGVFLRSFRRLRALAAWRA